MQNLKKILFFTQKNGLTLTSGAAILPIYKLNLQNHLSNLHTKFGRNRTFQWKVIVPQRTYIYTLIYIYNT